MLQTKGTNNMLTYAERLTAGLLASGDDEAVVPASSNHAAQNERQNG